MFTNINSIILLQLTVFFLVFFHLSAAKSPDEKIEISLANYDAKVKNGAAFHSRVILSPLSTTNVTIKNISPSVSFIILQTHTQDINITLVFNETMEISGSNVGLTVQATAVQFTDISVINPTNKSVPALVAAVAYSSQAPKPGGCNMEFSVKISPFQQLSLSKDNAMVQIDAQPSSAPIVDGKKLPCEHNFVLYSNYRLYANEWDFSEETYFSTMERMLTVEDILKNGEKVPSGLTPGLRTIFSAYGGTGSVYVLVATFNNFSASYVPSFSYGCHPRDDYASCHLLNGTLPKIFCASILFVGIFLTFVGHNAFGAELFIVGFFTGGIISTVVFHSLKIENSTLQIGLTILVGLVTGVIWVCVYFKIERPCIAILQASLLLGALIASTTYYGMSDEILLFKSDVTFWFIYAAIIMLVPPVVSIPPKNANIVCSAFLGSYAIILPIDYWQGSNLKYIIINTIRRITVHGFSVATIQPPFQTKDIWLSVMWVLLALFGMHVQRRTLAGRAPFPSRLHYTSILSNRSPTLSRARGGRRILAVDENDTVLRSTCCF